MAHRKSPLFATAASLIALTALTGCETGSGMFGSSASAEQQNVGNASYQAAMRVADDSRARGDMNNAITFYARANQFEPKLAQPLVELGDVFWQMKNPAESARALEEDRKIEPDNAGICRNLGRAYIALNEPKKAQEAYLASLALDPTNPRTLNGLGIAYDIDGDHDTAQSHYHAGLSMAPGNIDLLNNLAYSYISAKKYDEAIKILSPLVDSPNATARQRQNLALAYGLKGDESNARKIASRDLTPAAIDRNLKIYRELRNDPQHSLAMANIGRPGYTQPTDSSVPEMAPPPGPVSTEVVPPPEPEIVGVPEGATLIKPPAATPAATAPAVTATAKPVISAPVTAPAEADKPAATVAAPKVEPAQTRAQPVDLTPAPAQPASTLAAPTQSGLGSGKIYLGKFADEAAAREAWIKVWTGNSTVLGNLVASIEPADKEAALYAVGSSSAQEAQDTCTKLRQNGVSCGVSK